MELTTWPWCICAPKRGAMPITYQTAKIIDTNIDLRSCPCNYNVSTWKTVVSSEKGRFKRATEHRPFVLTPTGQAQMNRYDSVYGVVADFKWYPESCSGVARTCRKVTHQNAGTPYSGSLALGAFDYNKHNLKIRAAIAAKRVDFGRTLAQIDKPIKGILEFVRIVDDVRRCFTRMQCAGIHKRVVRQFTWKTVPAYYLLHEYGLQPLVAGVHSAVTELAKDNGNLIRFPALKLHPQPVMTLQSHIALDSPLASQMSIMNMDL